MPSKYAEILARAFRQARGGAIPLEHPPLLYIVFRREDEKIVIMEGQNFWIMDITSDDEEFHFVDNDGTMLTFPIPADWTLGDEDQNQVVEGGWV